MAKHPGPKTSHILIELEGFRNTCGAGSLTFCDVELTTDQRKRLEIYWQEKFEHWWDSWIAPDLKLLKDRFVK